METSLVTPVFCYPGTQTTFDVPRPTVTGQKGTSNNIVFVEVVVNRRLFVAGGETVIYSV